MLFAASTLLLAAASASALVAPHGGNSLVNRHHGIAARHANIGSPLEHAALEKRRAARKKRCVERNTVNTSTSVEVPENVAPAPQTTSSDIPHAEPTPDPAPPVVEQPAPAPAPAPEPAPAPAPAPAPEPQQPNNGGGGSGEIHSGDGTFFNVGLGACGATSFDNEYIVAVSWLDFDNYPGAGPNPNLNPICNKRIRISYQGKSVDATILDRCPGCTKGSVDLSPAAFSQIADQGLGRIHVTWQYI